MHEMINSKYTNREVKAYPNISLNGCFNDLTAVNTVY